MQKIINRTPSDWGFYSHSYRLVEYCCDNKLSPNLALATMADKLTITFEIMATLGKWNEVTHADVANILEDFAPYGAADSEGYSCAANLLIEIYGLTGEDAKTAYNQYRYPLTHENDVRIIDSLKLALRGE